MSEIEAILKSFPPTKVPDDLWIRVRRGQLLERKPNLYLRGGLMMTAAAGFLGILFYIITSAPSNLELGREAPEETFKKLEDTLLNSRAARVAFTFRGVDKDGKAQVSKSGVFMSKDGNKFRFEIKEGDDVEIVLVSDGAKLIDITRYKGKELPSKERDTPKDLPRLIGQTLMRTGNIYSIPAAIRAVKADGTDWSLPHDVTDIKRGENDKEGNVLTYAVKGLFEAKLWYDPKTNSLIKRVLTNPQLGTYTEVYKEYSLNVDLAGEQFKVPPTK